MVRQTGTFMRLVFGEFSGERSARAEAFLELCRKAGFATPVSASEFKTELWLKFIVPATNGAVTAATRHVRQSCAAIPT